MSSRSVAFLSLVYHLAAGTGGSCWDRAASAIGATEQVFLGDIRCSRSNTFGTAASICGSQNCLQHYAVTVFDVGRWAAF